MCAHVCISPWVTMCVCLCVSVRAHPEIHCEVSHIWCIIHNLVYFWDMPGPELTIWQEKHLWFYRCWISFGSSRMSPGFLFFGVFSLVHRDIYIGENIIKNWGQICSVSHKLNSVIKINSCVIKCIQNPCLNWLYFDMKCFGQLNVLFADFRCLIYLKLCIYIFN